MKAVLINYNFDPQDWWLDYGFNPEDVTIYDRSDDKIKRDFAGTVIKTPNSGDVDYDKLSYLIDNYDNLPEVFLWGKTNMFKFVEPTYLKKCLYEAIFAPLLKFNHKTYSDQWGEVCRYRGNIYEERNDSWYFNNPALSRKFNNWDEWANYLLLPKPAFIPFAPGGNYILTSERVHLYSKDMYVKMRETLDYATHPAEAHAAERTYYLLWQ